ncbi:MAG: WhiB family transcriptional regulator [Acidimicrobiales bacterium]
MRQRVAWIDDAPWRRRAACRSSSPELFFPAGATGMAVSDMEEAKAVCSGCVVRRECLDFALATNQEFGVWGGTTEEDRRTLRRNRPASAVRSVEGVRLLADSAASR